MKVICNRKNSYILRFDYQEDFLEELRGFIKKEKVAGGWISGLGGIIDPEVAYYDLKKKKYLNKKLNGVFEVVNLTGNIARLGKQVAIHIHISLGDRKYKVLGGHLVSGKVGGTLEVFLNGGYKLKRRKDGFTGLHLLN